MTDDDALRVVRAVGRRDVFADADVLTFAGATVADLLEFLHAATHCTGGPGRRFEVHGPDDGMVAVEIDEENAVFVTGTRGYP